MNEIPVDSRRLLITMGRSSQSHLFVSISDTGPGIHHEHRDKLASPFFSTKENGMGLGLAISRTIVEDHGGQLTHSPNSDGGITFTFTLEIGDTPASSE
jgi:C4-dicarboxylate-specific signal transduction histidine kinase